MSAPVKLQLSWVDGGGILGVLELDAILRENHQFAAKATQFPVETGAVVSDHVIHEPEVVRLEVIVSDTPLPAGMGVDPETFRENAKAGMYVGRAAETIRRVRWLMEEAYTVRLTSTIGEYDNMVIETVDLPVDSSGVARFSISLRRVVQVGLRTVAAPKIEKAEPIVHKGKQGTVEADPPLKSLAAKALDRIKGGSAWRIPKVGP